MTFLFLLNLLLGESITQQAVTAHVKFLSDDLLEGREATFRGQKIAARYIAGHFARYGLEELIPGSDNPYFHSFPLYSTGIDEDRVSLSRGDTVLRLEKDFYFQGFHPVEGVMNMKAAFLGFGYRSNKHNYNDYDGLDLEGKLVFVLNGYPPHLAEKYNDSERRRQHLLDKKIRWARKSGAGALIILDNEEFGLPEFGVERTESNEHRKLSKKPTKLGGNDFPVLVLNQGIAAKLLGDKMSNIKKALADISETQAPSSFAIDDDFRLETVFEELELMTENVGGIVRGTDPNLKNEYLVVSAHYDHIGKKGDDVYNGADDNASGTALLIDMARRIAAKPTKRSIIFLALTAEEKGLIGSSVFLEDGPIPIEQIVGDINIDMVGRNDELELGVIPARNEDVSTFNQQAQELNKKMEKPFKFIEEFDRYHHRSDHYNFCKRDIPAIFFFAGDHPDYHQPSDTWDKVNFIKIVRVGELVEGMVQIAGNSPERPAFLTPRATAEDNSEN